MKAVEKNLTTEGGYSFFTAEFAKIAEVFTFIFLRVLRALCGETVVYF